MDFIDNRNVTVVGSWWLQYYNMHIQGVRYLTDGFPFAIVFYMKQLERSKVA